MKFIINLQCLLLLIPALVTAKGWDIRLSNGLTLTKLLPINASTNSNDIRYTFKEGLYITPALYYNWNAYTSLSMEYSVQVNKLGFTHKSNNSDYGISYRSSFYDSYFLHNIGVGIHKRISVFKQRLFLGTFLKLGIGYGKFSGTGASISHGVNDDPNIGTTSYQTDFSGVNTTDFLMPNATFGIAITPNFKSKLSNSITFELAVLGTHRNIFRDYSRYSYRFENNVHTETGNLQYQGAPLTLQGGVNIRMFKLK